MRACAPRKTFGARNNQASRFVRKLVHLKACVVPSHHRCGGSSSRRRGRRRRPRNTTTSRTGRTDGTY